MSAQPNQRRQPWSHPRCGRRLRRRQRGLSFTSAVFGLLLVVFFGTIAITMLPSYAGFWQVRSIMNGLQDRPDIIAKGPRGITSSLGTLLSVNGIRDLHARDFKLEREQGGYKLMLDYDVRKHLFFNVDVVMAFNHEVLLRSP
ncbi:MAG: DUF4845 domain-containing protein [Thiohalocapsa sp.]|jgi:hypothetical protein|uniref:DUF4845 domain-containing protein n=1 Tax=Thiohalocapsa sp. TaxID=2497641 RepID=UPI0025D38CD2|nr:DUF4845 domain-containing protein [Thiohalocapsa sp.]MCG6939783.1 DUF4845 domain-containing protein [Thiohalocapsa sp.]